jgi:sulfide:quinone oxidoreductase
MPKHIVIVGGGVGGTITANLLARHLPPQDAEITLIESSGKHLYMPNWLYLPFNQIDRESEQLARNEKSLLNWRVEHVCGEVTRIDAVDHELHVRNSEAYGDIQGTGGAVSATYRYDYLVLATGARLAFADLNGLNEFDGDGQWYHFYSAEGALELRQALHEFAGGRIVIAIGGIPYRCPPAPLEFTFLLDEWLHKRGLRERTEIRYLFPLSRVFPIESVAEAVTPMLEERDVHYNVFFNTESVDTKARRIASMEGEEFPYDLLVVIPPHRGARVIEASGIGDEQGWLPTDRHTLEVKGLQNVYAIGDATDLPVSKSGSAAHFQAKVVAARVTAAVRGETPDPKEANYDGEVMCFLETGYNKATQLVFNYEHPPLPPRPSRYYHMEKQLFNRAYWHIVPQGLV